jgi:Uma2 family endonuclease
MSDKPHSKNRKNLATVAEFEVWLSKKKTDYNYEFVNGQIVKKNAMKQNELFISQFLTRRFSKTSAYLNNGELTAEIDVYIDEYSKRIPDLAYFTDEQIKAAAKGTKVVPAFVIELLSDSESYDSVEDKINDYFRAGVQIVWYLNPKKQSIHLYSSAKEIKVLTEDDICSAKPVIPDFEFVVKTLFVV